VVCLLNLDIKEIKYQSNHDKIWGTLGGSSKRSFELEHGIIITSNECLTHADAVIFIDNKKYDLGSTSDTSTFKYPLKEVLSKLKKTYKLEKYCKD
jgi:hypothetical protein